MSALLQLAERCEAATGPNTDLNFAIYAALNPEKDCSGIRRSQRYLYGEPYTASLDAAMTLVPEGFDMLVRKDINEATGFANVSRPDANMVLNRFDEERQCYVGSHEGHNYATGATPALALCAAALRARAAQGGEQ